VPCVLYNKDFGHKWCELRNVTTSSLSPALPFGRTVLEIRYEIDIMKVMTLPV